MDQKRSRSLSPSPSTGEAPKDSKPPTPKRQRGSSPSIDSSGPTTPPDRIWKEFACAMLPLDKRSPNAISRSSSNEAQRGSSHRYWENYRDRWTGHQKFSYCSQDSYAAYLNTVEQKGGSKVSGY
ncbi:hypothetical protein TWF506_002842 [Arthrobotrys conoides]|uniref:Uncharacterized protein n=1 Tax=Arthrobotrys conoides TaxID=74498 RepID=A0AAN8RJ53_9PEZI